MASTLSIADRRTFGRRPTYQFAIVHRSGRPPLRCIVRDISEGGALLEFGEPIVLPSRVRVVWEGSTLELDCDVRHTQGTKAGVQFCTQAGLAFAREMIALKPAQSMPPLAPPPRIANPEGPEASLSVQLVQKFRSRRSGAAEETSGVISELQVLVIDELPMPPRPWPAYMYARPMPPVPMPAYMYAESLIV